jgi:hypothetical protein
MPRPQRLRRAQTKFRCQHARRGGGFGIRALGRSRDGGGVSRQQRHGGQN